MAHMAETNPPQHASGRAARPVRRNLPQGAYGRLVVSITLHLGLGLFAC